MTTTKLFSGKELDDPEKHLKRFKLNVLSNKLPADAEQNLQTRFGYLAKTLTDAASEWFDSLVIANIADTDALYNVFQTRFVLHVTDQWRENQMFRQIKQDPSELSTDFIKRKEAKGVRIKATVADVRDTILQGLLPAILKSVMQLELGDSLDDIRKWSKMAERYSNTSLDSGKDISEIKSTLNVLATRLDRTQLRAVTPEKRKVQFSPATPTQYPREPSPTAPIRNFDPITGQRLHNVPRYDVTTGERLPDSVPSRQRQKSFQDRPPPRIRSPSPSYIILGRDNNDKQYYSQNYNRSSSSNRGESQQYASDNENNRPKYNTRCDMYNRVTVVKVDIRSVTTEANHHAEGCSPTEGRHEIIKEATDRVN